MKNHEIIKELNAIMEKGLQEVHLPYAKGKSIRIRNTVIRKSRDGFLVFDVKTHQRVAETFSKRGAIAYAKAREKNRDHDCDHILSLDNLLCKHYMDSLFHKNVIEKTEDEWRKEAIITRFEIAKDKTFDTMDQIDHYIFDE